MTFILGHIIVWSICAWMVYWIVTRDPTTCQRRRKW